jgi:hypothetical protein
MVLAVFTFMNWSPSERYWDIMFASISSTALTGYR